MSHVMISYSRNDESHVRLLNERLRQNGVKTWVDWLDIPGGVSWRQAVYDAVIACDAIIPVLSPHYLDSEMCRMELFLARSYDKRILPLMIQECMQELPLKDETKGIEDIFMLWMHSLYSVGVKLDEAEAYNRLLAAIRQDGQRIAEDVVYVAYPWQEANYAVQIANDLSQRGLATWVAARDMPIGVDWRKHQTQVMMRASALIVVISEAVSKSRVLQKEILLARTRGLKLLPIVSETIMHDDAKLREMREALDQTYESRLLSEIQWFSAKAGYASLLDTLQAALSI